MHLSIIDNERSTIQDISRYYNVSKNHLMKVVHQLASLGYITSTQGRGGGISLAISADKISVGEIVRKMEPTLEPVDCNKSVCTIRSVCLLKGILNEASTAFLKTLDGYSISDLVSNKPQLINSIINISVKKNNFPLH